MFQISVDNIYQYLNIFGYLNTFGYLNIFGYFYYKHLNENRNHSQSSSEANKLVVEANLLLTY